MNPTLVSSAFNGLCAVYRIGNDFGFADVRDYLDSTHDALMDLIPEQCKYYLVLHIELEMDNKVSTQKFASKAVNASNDLQLQLEEAFSKIISRLMKVDGAWCIQRILQVDVHYMRTS